MSPKVRAHVGHVQLIEAGFPIGVHPGAVRVDAPVAGRRVCGHLLRDQRGCLLEVLRRRQHLGELSR